MSLPSVLVLAVVLLLGSLARAQPSPTREPRQRTVTVSGNPAEAPQPLHVAQGVTTVLLFKSLINESAVEVDRARVKLVDAGDWGLILEPLVEPGTGERLLLSVPFADGSAPGRAVFELVTSPTEVDTRVDVVRSEPTVETCPAQLAEAQARCARSSPARFAREGWLTRQGVVALPVEACHRGASAVSGLRCVEGTVYLAETWALVDVTLFNEPGQPPWAPNAVSVQLKMDKKHLKPRTVELERPQLLPGARGRVLVELAPPKLTGEFRLELKDASGRGLTIHKLKLSERESKP